MAQTSILKTFDDTYGRHALVIVDRELEPSFGRVDVIKLMDDNRGRRLHPSRISADYNPAHIRP